MNGKSGFEQTDTRWARGQINKLTDKLASNKWPTGLLEREMAGNNE
jgi:hypothetical protein